MSLNASANSTDNLMARSIHIINIQTTSHIVWATVSSLAILIGGLQFLTIAFWKPLRKLDQCLIIALAAVDFVKSVGFDALAIRKLVEIALAMDDVSTQRRCLYWVAACDIPLNIAYIMINMLSLDRLLALAIPVWYKDRKSTLKLLFVGFSILAGCLTGIWIFLGTSDTRLDAACAQPTAATASYRTFTWYLSTGSVIACLVTNAATCACLIARWHSARKLKKDMKSFKKSVELSALKTLLSVVLVYLVTSATAAVWRIIQDADGIPPSDESKAGRAPLSITFEILRGVLDFPTYVILVKEYRNGFKSVILRRFIATAASQVSSVKVRTLTIRELHVNSGT